MTEPENFLTRWSRRKLDAEEQAVPAAEAAPQKPAVDAEDIEKRNVTANEAREPVPAFDLASLPSLDSIGADTDISVFLKAGVPGDLRIAALRRAWVADPAIRDFKGLAENDWDFTIPNETMGFAEIDPTLDMKKMLGDIFGDTPRAEPESAEALPTAEQPTPAPDELDVTADRVALHSNEVSLHDQHAASDTGVVRRNNDTAPHADNIASHADDTAPHADDEEKPDASPLKQKRRQGGALPQ
jgi:hypothetical protein